MKPESPSIDQQGAVSPHAQEIEYALILQRMINVVKEDPAQMRMAIYEFARARLNTDTTWADEGERKRLSDALETAIVGVERFSQHREDKGLLPAPNPAVPASHAIAQGAPHDPPSSSLTTIRHVTPAPEDILEPDRAYERRADLFVVARMEGLISKLTRLCIALMVFGIVAGVAYYKQALPLLHRDAPPLTAAKPARSDVPPAESAAGDLRTAVESPGAPPFPVPVDYGVYAIVNDKLSELQPLVERVPDKRIAVSTPVSQPSRTTLPDGKARFIVFRRDLTGSAPDRVDVRVVARVVRALTFDAKGKPNFAPVSDSWNMRSMAHEFRVRPVPGKPEMLLMQPDKPDFELPAGRYVLVLKDQGYDFTVDGKITDVAQCLERTEAANGTFYSECQKP